MADSPDPPYTPPPPRARCAHCGGPMRRGRRVYCSDQCAALEALARRSRERAAYRAECPRYGYCADCGVTVWAGGVRGPLPQRCPRCRAIRRRAQH